MTSLEGLFRELFLRNTKARSRTLWAGLAMYLLLSCGYLREYAKGLKGTLALPAMPRFGVALKQSLSVLPMALFYILIPIALAWAIGVILDVIMLNFLIPVVWGALVITAWMVFSVALLVVEADPERFFLGIGVEDVVVKAWKIKEHLFFPAIFCYGLAVILGPWFYGFSFFVAIAVLTAYANVALEK